MTPYEFLKNIKKRQLVVICVEGQRAGNFYVGYITRLTQKEVVINQVDRLGQDDGMLAVELRTIVHTSHSTNYLDHIAFALNNPLTLKKAVPLCTSKKAKPLISELHAAMAAEEPVTIKITSEEDVTHVTGIVTELDEDWVQLREFSSDGLDDGVSLLNVHYIASVDRNSRVDQKLLAYNKSLKRKK